MNRMKIRGKPVQEHSPSTLTSGFLTIRQVARMLGLTERSVYGYLQAGRLAGERIENALMVRAESVAAFTPKGSGRRRIYTPRWRQPPGRNAEWFTTITFRQYPGQAQRLEQALSEIRRNNTHCFPGTTARFIVRGQNDPTEITLVLVWRVDNMPPEEERRAALAALCTDLGEILDWETAGVKEGFSLMHA